MFVWIESKAEISPSHLVLPNLERDCSLPRSRIDSHALIEICNIHIIESDNINWEHSYLD